MRYAINLPIIGDYANPHVLLQLAQDAESAGWDGVFVWGTMLLDEKWQPPVIDNWTMLAAIATHTKRVKIGTMIEQLARRQPWEVARQIATVDHLSNGRVIFGAALGYSGAADFAQFGLNPNDRVRADRLDEALDIVAGLLTGEPFSYQGAYYQIKETCFTPRPIQAHVPIWIGGYWPNKRPFRRAARWDGACPTEVEPVGDDFRIISTSPATVEAISTYIAHHRTDPTQPYDMVVSRGLHEDPMVLHNMSAAYAAVGVTWLLCDMLPWEVTLEMAQKIVRKGPPT